MNRTAGRDDDLTQPTRLIALIFMLEGCSEALSVGLWVSGSLPGSETMPKWRPVSCGILFNMMSRHGTYADSCLSRTHPAAPRNVVFASMSMVGSAIVKPFFIHIPKLRSERSHCLHDFELLAPTDHPVLAVGHLSACCLGVVKSMAACYSGGLQCSFAHGVASSCPGAELLEKPHCLHLVLNCPCHPLPLSQELYSNIDLMVLR